MFIVKEFYFRLTAFLFFISAFLNSSAQEIDSLQHLKEKLTGTEKIDAANQLAFRLLLIDFKRASSVIDEALDLSTKGRYTKGLSEAMIYKGIYENLSGQKAAAVADLKKGIKYADEVKLKGLEGYGWVQLGNVYRSRAIYDSAKDYYDRAYVVLKDSVHPMQLSVLYRNLALFYSANSQPLREFDYLKRALRIRERISDKVLLVDILINLSRWYLSQSQLEKAKEFLERAQQSGFPKSLMEIQKDIDYQRATILFREGNYKEAISLMSNVKDFYFQAGNSVEYIKSKNNIAELLEELDNYELSLNNLWEALKMGQDKKILGEVIRSQILIGRNYYRIKQFKLAHQYADSALAFSLRNKLLAEEGDASNLIGLILKAEKKYQDAVTWFEKAIAIRRQLDAKKGLASSLANMGEAFEGLGQIDKALDIQQQSILIKESILHQSGLAWGYYDMGSLYAKRKQFNLAKDYLDKSEEKARFTKSGNVLLNVYKLRREIASQTGNIEAALNYSYLYESMKDSIYTVSVTNKVLALESLHELDRKQKEIELLKEREEVNQDRLLLQQSKLERQNIVIITSLVGLVLLGSLAFLYFKYNQKTNRFNQQLQIQNKEIQRQAIALKESNQALSNLNGELSDKQEEIQAQSEELKEAFEAVITLNEELKEKTDELLAQSEELRTSNEVISKLNQSLEDKVGDRTRKLSQAYKELDTFFYRSSHDFRRPLTTFLGLAEVARITVQDKNALELFSKVKETAQNLDRMLLKLQFISLVSSDQNAITEISVEDLFSDTIFTFREEIQRLGMEVTMKVKCTNQWVSYPALAKMIIENLVENAIQFAKEVKPTLNLYAIDSGNGIMIQVTDNGIGIQSEFHQNVFDMFFRATEKSKGNGLGLYLVKKAVDKLNGTIKLESAFGQGTVIQVYLPSL
jgi:signal transduction histidine kinase